MVRKIPENKAERYKLLYFKELRPYKGKQFYSKAPGCFVRVTGKSIAETAHHASKSMLSTKLAIRLPYIIENAKVLCTEKPKNNKQTKTMKFQRMILLSCGIRGLGTALLTIGERKASVKNGKMENGEMIEYCITDLRFAQKKESSVPDHRAFYCRQSRQMDVRTCPRSQHYSPTDRKGTANNRYTQINSKKSIEYGY